MIILVIYLSIFSISYLGNRMYEIRFHGRGGQGAVTASKILATAAFKEGKWVTSFPFYGTERRGAPVAAFTRIDNNKVELRTQIYNPDSVILLDKSLMNIINVTDGLKENGLILINSKKNDVLSHPELKKFKVAVVDATSIAVRNKLGDPAHPIVNTAILGAYAKVSGIVKLESIIDATKELSPSKINENVNAVKEAYEEVEVI